jgi:hypothetical protein
MNFIPTIIALSYFVLAFFTTNKVLARISNTLKRPYFTISAFVWLGYWQEFFYFANENFESHVITKFKYHALL